jgi:CTP synthase (UTP-ammonia lyase)
LNIKVKADSLAWQVDRQTDIQEPFNCNFELNPDYRGRLEAAGLKVSGESETGGARIIELPDHKFFIATGFLPQLNSEAGKPHPLILAYLRACAG